MLAAGLAVDVSPFAAQLRCAASQARETVFRLHVERGPEWSNAVAAEGQSARDAAGTITHAKARIDDALSFPGECVG